MSLFRDGKVFGLYFRYQNLEETYRATFRDGNLEKEIFSCLKRNGNNFPSLNRDGNCFPSLFIDGNVFRLYLETEKFSSLFSVSILQFSCSVGQPSESLLLDNPSNTHFIHALTPDSRDGPVHMQ